MSRAGRNPRPSGRGGRQEYVQVQVDESTAPEGIEIGSGAAGYGHAIVHVIDRFGGGS